MDLQLEGKVAIVAGSSRGIGLAVAVGFLAAGASVTITGRDQKALGSVYNELAERHGKDRVLAVLGDMSAENHIAEALQQTGDTFGGIDAIIANVGSGRAKMGWQLSRHDWQQMLDINLLSGALLAAAGVPHLLKRGDGSITFISSIAGSEYIRAPMAYAAAKAAQQMMAKHLSRQLAAEKIRVNTVSPGNVMFPGGTWDDKRREDQKSVDDYIAHAVPLNRFATPEEIANAVLFLSSERAVFVTGSVMVVDGGQSLA